MREVWKRQALRRLEAVDRGEICVDCGSKDMTVTDGRATCGHCGEVRDLDALSAHRITPKELESLSSGNEKQGFWD